MHRAMFAAMITLCVTTDAVACSCVRRDNLSDAEWHRIVVRTLAEYPIAIEGHQVAVDRPLPCRWVPLRWLYAAAGASARVLFTVAIDRAVRGIVPRTVVVEQLQHIGRGGCHASGSPACDPAYRAGRQTLILKRDGAVYRRASTCAQRVATAALGLPAPSN